MKTATSTYSLANDGRQMTETAMSTIESRAFRLRSVLTVAACFAAGAVSAQSPRAPDGHPDLSGTWDNGAGIDFVQPRKEGNSICIFGCPGGAPPPNSVPQASVPKYRPELAARVADLD